LVDELCARNRKEDVSYDFIPLAYMTPYACSDVHYTWLIFKRLVVQISSHDDLKNLYVSEIALLRVLFETEHAGAKINRQYLNDVEPVLQSEILQLEQEIYNEIGYQFNIDSDDQLTDAMLKAGIKLTKLTKGSKKAIQEGKPDKVAYSVDKEVLAYLAAQYPFADKVLRYRKLQKLKDTYIIGIRDLLDDNDFLHSDYNQNVRTGRMSSREPNLQNIPARDKTIRKAFVTPSDEYVMFFFDYSQIELRLTADRSKDPALLACYPFHGKGEDVHTLTLAEVVLSQPLDQVKAMKSDKTGHVEVFGQCGCPACLYDFYRNVAKRVNFGIIYGVSDKGLVPQVSTPARQVSREECHAYIQAYLKKYEGVKEWIRATEVFMKKHGYVQNSFGRFRRLPNIKSMQKWEMERAARQGVNFLIQGEAADLFKIASVRVFDLLRKLNARSRLVNYVHDELQLYLHKDEMELIKPIKKAMEDFEYSVPIVAEAAYSLTDWGSKKELKE
jgi:DNA polymerase-1